MGLACHFMVPCSLSGSSSNSAGINQPPVNESTALLDHGGATHPPPATLTAYRQRHHYPAPACCCAAKRYPSNLLLLGFGKAPVGSGGCDGAAAGSRRRACGGRPRWRHQGRRPWCTCGQRATVFITAAVCCPFVGLGYFVAPCMSLTSIALRASRAMPSTLMSSRHALVAGAGMLAVMNGNGPPAPHDDKRHCSASGMRRGHRRTWAS